MFQYAFAKAIAVKYGTAVALDNSGFETGLFAKRRNEKRTKTPTTFLSR
jgi:hypothetical protein